MLEKEFEKALKFMGLSSFVTFAEIKDRYLELSKEFHPDFGGKVEDMEKLNRYFELLKKYVDGYRFSFSEDEIQKQHLGSDYADRFRF